MTFTIGSHPYHVSLLALVIVCLLVIAFLPHGGADETGWPGSGQQVIATHAAFVRRMDSLRAVALVAIHRAQRLAQDTARLRQATDSAVAQGAQLAAHQNQGVIETEIRRIGQACRRETETCQAISAKWEAAARENQTLAQVALARANHADSVIAAGLHATSCNVLFFHCPSRTRVAEVFFVAGVIGGALLARH